MGAGYAPADHGSSRPVKAKVQRNALGSSTRPALCPRQLCASIVGGRSSSPVRRGCPSLDRHDVDELLIVVLIEEDAPVAELPAEAGTLPLELLTTSPVMGLVRIASSAAHTCLRSFS